MGADIWQQLQQLGDEFTPASIGATIQMCAPLALRPEDVGAEVERDLAYGPDGRNRLDVYRSVAGPQSRPVVVFVHGGGFAAGDKGTASTPFYGNFGAWAVRNGYVGVVMTYRLAPVWQWPSGAEDVAAAVAWIRANIDAHGGDPARIVLIGQSAGGAHVAGYVAGHGSARPAVSAAVFLSGIYEPDAFASNPMHEVYFGTDRSSYAARSTVLGLASTDLPCLYTVSEFDPAQFQKQAAALFAARTQVTGKCPQLLYLHGHNHVSAAMLLGSSMDTLGPVLAGHVRRMVGERDQPA